MTFASTPALQWAFTNGDPHGLQNPPQEEQARQRQACADAEQVMAGYNGAVNSLGEPARPAPRPNIPAAQELAPTAIIPGITAELESAAHELQGTVQRLWKRLDSVIRQEPSDEEARAQPTTGVIHADRLAMIHDVIVNTERSLCRLLNRIES